MFYYISIFKNILDIFLLSYLMKLLLLIFIYIDDLNLCVFLYTFNGVIVINYFSIYGYRFCYNKIINKCI